MYKRVLIKISGEMLGDNTGSSLHQENLTAMCTQINTAFQTGVQIGIVVGGGNIARGSAMKFIDRTIADSIGMLSTSINALAIQNILKNNFHIESVIFGPNAIAGLYESGNLYRIEEAFSEHKLIIFAGGTGCSHFSTDTAGVLKALEIKAELMIKATKVDGVYDKDPSKHKDAVLYKHISYQEVLEKKLGVMDLTAICLAMENKLPIHVLDIFKNNNLETLLKKESTVGTSVSLLCE